MFPFGGNNKKQERKVQSRIAENQKLYRVIFDTPEGKKVLEDLAKRCFENYTTYDSSDSKKIYFNEGRRSVYKYITNLLEKDLTQILEELTK